MDNYFRFPCPNPVCGKRLKARLGQVGRNTRCPTCGQSLVVSRPLTAFPLPLPTARPVDSPVRSATPRRFPLGWVGLGVALLAVLLAGVILADHVPAGSATACEIAAAVIGLAGLAVSLVGVLTRRGWVGGWIGVICGSLLIVAALLVGVKRGLNPPRVEQWYTTAGPLRGSRPGDSYHLNQPANGKVVFVVVKARIAGRDLYRKTDDGKGFSYQFKTDDVQLVAANGETFPAGLSDSGGGFAFTRTFTDDPADGSHEFAFAVDEWLVRDGPIRLQVRGTPGPDLAPNLQTSAPAR